MGTFMATNKKVTVSNVSASTTLEVDSLITLSFYIIERIQETTISTIDYRVDKINGRVSAPLTAWTNISMVGVTDDIYDFDYTLTGVVATDKVEFTFRIVDEDGVESFIAVNNFDILV